MARMWSFNWRLSLEILLIGNIAVSVVYLALVAPLTWVVRPQHRPLGPNWGRLDQQVADNAAKLSAALVELRAGREPAEHLSRLQRSELEANLRSERQAKRFWAWLLIGLGPLEVLVVLALATRFAVGPARLTAALVAAPALVVSGLRVRAQVDAAAAIAAGANSAAR